MLTLRLILIRHGETQLNSDGRIQGLNNAPLTLEGQVQSAAVGRALIRDLPFRFYTSPVARAVETAEIASKALNLAPAIMTGLREADVGCLDGLTGQQMRLRYPNFAERWTQNAATARMPGGESLQEVQDRAWPVIVELMSNHPDHTVVAVTHNFTIQSILCKLLGMTLHNSRRLRLAVGSITRLDLSSTQMELVSLNETWHLHDNLTNCDAGQKS